MTANLFFVALVATAFWLVFGVGGDRFSRIGSHALNLEDPLPLDPGSATDQQEAESDDRPADLRTAFDEGFCDQTDWLRGFIEEEAGLRALLARYRTAG